MGRSARDFSAKFPINGRDCLDGFSGLCFTRGADVRQPDTTRPSLRERSSMSVLSTLRETPSREDMPEREPLLLWMIFTGLSIFAFVLLWRYGFIRLMVISDRTYISTLIVVLYVITCFHCFWRTRAIA